jgi:hypothetical protein
MYDDDDTNVEDDDTQASGVFMSCMLCMLDGLEIL